MPVVAPYSTAKVSNNFIPTEYAGNRQFHNGRFSVFHYHIISEERRNIRKKMGLNRGPLSLKVTAQTMTPRATFDKLERKLTVTEIEPSTNQP